ncbi:hypothetical protein K1719_007867 [Acacia pycnantha]|nr:hypothetical protein K1719_007867 [Acacia pycnantha]
MSPTVTDVCYNLPIIMANVSVGDGAVDGGTIRQENVNRRRTVSNLYVIVGKAHDSFGELLTILFQRWFYHLVLIPKEFSGPDHMASDLSLLSKFVPNFEKLFVTVANSSNAQGKGMSPLECAGLFVDRHPLRGRHLIHRVLMNGGCPGNC